MIVFFNKEKSFKPGDNFPLIGIPIDRQGEKKDFNDFQWWAPTKDWEGWLKNNPRNWQAEAEEFSSYDKKSLYEIFVAEGIVNKEVMGFEEFSSIFEEEKDQNLPGAGQKASPENKKKYTKFFFAFNKLKEEGKIKENLSIKDLGKGKDYAIILDLPSEDKTPIPETRNAYKTKIIGDLKNGLLAEIDESIPFGKFENKNEAPGNQIFKIAGFGAQLATSAVAVAGTVAGGFYLVKGAKNLISRFGAREAIQGGSAVMNGLMNSGAQAAGGSWNGAGYYINGVKQVFGGKGKSFAANTIPKGSKLIKSQAAYNAAFGGPVTGGLGTAGTVALVVAAVVAAWEIGQRVYNFTSTNQAPRLGEIEDEGWARDYFAPGPIPNGESITICWTQESGNNWFSNLLWNEDTRTTMDLIKIGNFEGKSIFLLVKINSKQYDALLKTKEMILLAFPENVVVKRGWFDNDDLEFELISIDKGAEDLAVSTIFQGYCDWEEMESAYKGSDDEFIGVPANAPDDYEFHFKSGKNNWDINVKGELIKDIGSVDVLTGSLDYTPSATTNESDKFFDNLDWEKISESSEVIKFEDFHKLPRKINFLYEEEPADAASSGTEFSPGYPTPPDADAAGATGTGAEGEEKKYLTKKQEIAAYTVKSIEYADKSLEGQELPKLETFIIPNEYLETGDQDPIYVQPIQEVTLKYPKRGTVIVESEVVPDPISPEENPGLTGGVPITVTKGEVVSKYKDRPEFLNKIGVRDVSKIKDKDKKDDINLLDMITPEEKEELGMSDWSFIRKIKIYKDGETKEPIMIKFKGGGKKKKIKASDPNFNTALAVAERVQAGFIVVGRGENTDKEEEEDKEKTPDLAKTPPSSEPGTSSPDQKTSETTPETTPKI